MLPSATSARFVLLMLTTAIGSIMVFSWIAGLFGGTFRGPVAAARVECVNDARRQVLGLDGAALTDGFTGCVNGAYRSAFGQVAAMVGVLLLVAVLAYALAPRFISREPLRPLAAMPDSPAVRSAHEVLAASGQPVHVEVATLRGTAGARAFGRFGRYRIMLDMGLLAHGGRDPRVLRGVLSHELAHVRNRDIDITYLTLALWWGFLAVVVVPAVIYSAVEPAMLTQVSWRLALFLVVLWLTRTAVLRSREYYADARAVETGGDTADVAAALQPRHGGRRRWRFGANHPTESQRLAALDDHAVLFRLHPGEALGAGVLLGFAYPLLGFLLGTGWPDARLYVHDWILGLLLGMCAAAVVAGSAWRAVQRALADADARPPATWPAAAALTGGLLLGQLLTPNLPEAGSWAQVLWSEPLVATGVAAVLLVLCQVYLRWVVRSAYCHLRGNPRPRGQAIFGVLAAAAVFGWWVSAWLKLPAMLVSSYPTWQTVTIGLGAMISNPVLVVGVIWACVYPVAGLIRGRQAEVGRALLTACAIAIGFALAMLPFQDRLGGLLRAGQVWPALGLCGVVAGSVVAVCAFGLGLWRGGHRRTGEAAVHAALAALTAVPVLVAVVAAYLITATCTTNVLDCAARSAGFAVQGLTGVTMAGAVLAVVLAALAAMAGSAVRVPLRPSTPPPPTGPRWLAVARLLPTVLAVAVIGGAGVAMYLRGTDNTTAMSPEAANLLRQYAASIRPGSLPRAVACSYGLAAHSYGVGLTDLAGTTWPSRLGVAATAAASSDDIVLQKLGNEAMRALLAADLTRNHQANRAIANYCGIVAAAEAAKVPADHWPSARGPRAGVGQT
ncbi:hypothetical protein CS0771_65630 [Catellatospora sp. IY07-71]|nr:hypothetical protein CS0771_65630 [Catellatospora sp. IY07-71]